jgi:carbonic anhydrase/acetyltransferase-like protein (isoleucine patch superfamily)
MIFSFEGKTPALAEDAYVAPGAVIIGDVKIGKQSSVWFQTVLRGDINSITIGEQSNIQDGCLLHVTHSLAVSVGNRVTVGHGVILHGCSIGDDCLIAMGAIILDGAVVEAGSIVGAGSLVPPGAVVKAGGLVLGSPARTVRQLAASDRENIASGWRHYIEYAGRFQQEIKS